MQRGQPNSINAWQSLQRGLLHFYRFNQRDRAEAIRLFKEAISADPSFALAHARLSYTLSSSVLWGYTEDRDDIIASARSAAERAVSLDINEPLARFAMGRAHVFDGDVNLGISEKAAAIKINPNYARGHFGLGWAHYYGAGQPQEAISHFTNALRLSSRDPTRWATFLMLGSALRDLGRHEMRRSTIVAKPASSLMRRLGRTFSSLRHWQRPDKLPRQRRQQKEHCNYCHRSQSAFCQISILVRTRTI